MEQQRQLVAAGRRPRAVHSTLPPPAHTCRAPPSTPPPQCRPHGMLHPPACAPSPAGKLAPALAVMQACRCRCRCRHHCRCCRRCPVAVSAQQQCPPPRAGWPPAHPRRVHPALPPAAAVQLCLLCLLRRLRLLCCPAAAAGRRPGSRSSIGWTCGRRETPRRPLHPGGKTGAWRYA